MKEELREVKGYDGTYLVSNIGKIYSLHSGELKEKKAFAGHHGYLRVALFKNGKGKKYFVHRLVAESFIENTDNCNTVDHINKNTSDNNIDNLRWMDGAQNTSRSLSHLTQDDVRYIRQNYQRGNGIELSNKFDLDLSMIVKIHKIKAFKWVS